MLKVSDAGWKETSADWSGRHIVRPICTDTFAAELSCEDNQMPPPEIQTHPVKQAKSSHADSLTYGRFSLDALETSPSCVTSDLTNMGVRPL